MLVHRIFRQIARHSQLAFQIGSHGYRPVRAFVLQGQLYNSGLQDGLSKLIVHQFRLMEAGAHPQHHIRLIILQPLFILRLIGRIDKLIFYAGIFCHNPENIRQNPLCPAFVIKIGIRIGIGHNHHAENLVRFPKILQKILTLRRQCHHSVRPLGIIIAAQGHFPAGVKGRQLILRLIYPLDKLLLIGSGDNIQGLRIAQFQNLFLADYPLAAGDNGIHLTAVQGCLLPANAFKIHRRIGKALILRKFIKFLCPNIANQQSYPHAVITFWIAGLIFGVVFQRSQHQ